MRTTRTRSRSPEDTDRLTLTLGKLSATDIFDSNAYSHDPRTQFLNWALVDDGAWDYPADSKGYTGGFAAEWTFSSHTLRYGIFMEPQFANELPLDGHVGRRTAGPRMGGALFHRGAPRGDSAARLLEQGRHGALPGRDRGAEPAQFTLSRAYRSKAGAGLNWEQEVADGLGVFARAGFDDGRTETWAYTEIDRAISAGVQADGKRWGRSGDSLGLAVLASGLSSEHRKYLEAGGNGFILGDGRLDYEPEEIIEVYYLWQPAKWLAITPDYQFIQNPDTTATAAR